ncbi:dnaJ homolog subfamily C member 30, mitochondrial-like [Diadema antillarum]|uniref:dnaJ homolog subfamily C member 30, mitochondrial-like n=1 Tax=Diadema antillarum TaxID=105358 RepID=UPI003A84FD96
MDSLTPPDSVQLAQQRNSRRAPCCVPNPRKRDRNYYEVLNITPNATQAQVKEAFFKLSKVYHPDKNAGSKEAQRQFSSINEAYSVLGNLTLRKRYDRGTLNQKDIYGEVKEEEVDKATFSGAATYTTGGIPFHEEAERQAKKMDAFFESHYKAAREKEQQDRVDRQRRIDEYMELQSKAKHSPIILAAFIVTAIGLAVKSVIYDSKVDKKLRAAAKGKK